MKNYLTVKGRNISYEIKDIDIFKLEYYKDNPRINHIISKTPNKLVTQEFIELELLKRDETKELIKDLEDNLGLIDEIYVVGNKVVEGNTRLCAYRRLYKKHDQDKKWKYIKCRLILDDIKDEELFYILSTFHIKGKTAWDAYEKSAYIYKMVRELNKTPEEISRHIGKQKRTIEAMLKAYEVMSDKYFENGGLAEGELLSDNKDDLNKYSYFEAFYLQRELAKKAEETPEFVDTFVEWVKEERFRKAQEVRDLHKILTNKKATEKFKNETPEEAYREAMDVLYLQSPGKVDGFYKKVKNFREFIGESNSKIIKDEIEDNKNKKYELEQCYKTMKQFCKEIGINIK